MSSSVVVDTHGRVANSNTAIKSIASSRVLPHMAVSGCRLAQNTGRSGRPNKRQRSVSSNCTHGMPAGLPWGIPGMGEVIEGAVQQAPQPVRQSMGSSAQVVRSVRHRGGLAKLTLVTLH